MGAWAIAEGSSVQGREGGSQKRGDLEAWVYSHTPSSWALALACPPPSRHSPLVIYLMLTRCQAGSLMGTPSGSSGGTCSSLSLQRTREG